jgi:hypothetical protein
MTLKNASLLALFGTLLLTILVLADLILNFLNLLRGLIPAMMLLTSLIYALAALSVTVFFYTYYKAQS